GSHINDDAIRFLDRLINHTGDRRRDDQKGEYKETRLTTNRAHIRRVAITDHRRPRTMINGIQIRFSGARHFQLQGFSAHRVSLSLSVTAPEITSRVFAYVCGRLTTDVPLKNFGTSSCMRQKVM